jgi:hypothetical protein
VASSGIKKAIRKEDKKLYCDWICPSREEYRSYLYNIIQEIDDYNIAGIHLDSVNMPGTSYCQCDNCKSEMKELNRNFIEFRINKITGFIKKVSELTRKQLSMTLYPDPFYPERFGLDIISLSDYVDFFLIPLYDINYSTLYWVEILANAFTQKLKKPFYFMLYAKNVKQENLVNASKLILEFSDRIIFSYDNDKAVKVKRIIN